MGELCKRYVSGRLIRDKMEVSNKTIRSWSKKLNWREQKINARVIRYCAEDVQRTLNVDLA